MLLRRLLRSTSLGSLAMIEAASKRRTWMQKGAAAGLSLAATTLLLAGCAGNAQVSSRSGAAGYTRGHAAPGPQLAQANLSAAASAGPESPAAIEDSENFSTHDPLEKVNRVIFSLDMTLDKYALRPVAKAYRDNVPSIVRTALTNVLHNIESPVIFANDLLQGNVPRAGQTFARIWMNTILGVGGFNDVATKAGIPFHDADFGQTLGVWGVGPGPYLVLPILGPSDPRDAVGFGVDSIGSPFGYAMREAGVGTQASLSESGATVINDRSQTIDELDELQRNSLDFYATVRSLYQQKRAGDVAAGRDRSLPPPAKAQTSRLPARPAAHPVGHVGKRARNTASLPVYTMPKQSAGLDLHVPFDAVTGTPSALNQPAYRGGAS